MKKFILIFTLLAAMSVSHTPASAQVFVSVNVRVAPPAIPVYEQPPCPNEGYMWCPGYWAWSSDGYYWVPGVWVAAPQPGYLWTPGYWGFAGGYYGWHGGYWGPHVGYYGGICYGYGYGGTGFYGGRWAGGSFQYNTAVWHVGGGIHNVYVDHSVNNTVVNHASYNGPGGAAGQPTQAERSAMSEHHIQATSVQQSHQTTASQDRNQFASVNHGKPATTAMSKPGGSRFGAEGHAAPAPVARTASPANHGTANPNVSHSAAVGSHPTQSPGASHPSTPAPVHQSQPMHQPQPMHQSQPQHQQQPMHQAPRPAPHPAPQREPEGRR